MEEVGCHHERELGIIVCLGTNEAVSISHGNRIVKTLLEQPVQLPEVGDGVDAPALTVLLFYLRRTRP